MNSFDCSGTPALVTMSIFVNVCVLICLSSTIAPAESEHLYLKEGESCKETIEGPWPCKLLKECPKAMEMLTNGTNPEFCGFKGFEAMVCCETEVNVTVGAKAREMCKKYAESVFIQLPNGLDGEITKYDTCAKKKPTTRSKRVDGGEESQFREYPHMALIGFVSKKRREPKWYCGGTLISDRFILTSGTCSKAHRDEVPKIVKLGDHNIMSDKDEDSSDAQPTEYEIEKIFTHPGYNQPSLYNDIAVLKLKTAVYFTEFIRPICLHTFQNLSPTVLVTGWVRTEIGLTSDTLQTASISVYNHADCYERYINRTGTPMLENGISEAQMICARDPKGIKDSCHGDSGGPLQVRLEEPYCMYSQVGITSFGLKCGEYPGVYTRVSYYIPWIESIVWPDEQSDQSDSN